MQQVVQTPRVGDSILVKHGSDGEGRTKQLKPHADIISAVYIGGKVRVGPSDTYQVKLNASGNPRWETWVPVKEKK